MNITADGLVSWAKVRQLDNKEGFSLMALTEGLRAAISLTLIDKSPNAIKTAKLLARVVAALEEGKVR
jgi:SH3-like domain-containing protein